MKTKGFTLIELLIVIALLGALAIGLLATIDPFEQLKKGRDTATRNTATEFFNANLRYYGTKGEFPWGTAVQFSAESLASHSTDLLDLINAGELKTNFEQAAGVKRMNDIIITSTADDQIGVCFDPESKNFALDSNTIYDIQGDVSGSAGCRANSDSGSMSCYWCIQ